VPEIVACNFKKRQLSLSHILLNAELLTADMDGVS